MKKQFVMVGIAAMLVAALSGCGKKENKPDLDPDNPVSITIWHYYNGSQQATFEAMVEEFNATVGKEEGIYVESISQGSVTELERAVTSSLKGEVGADTLPDMFSSYVDTAYSAQSQGKLTDLTEYFSEEELAGYIDSYVQEGYLKEDGALYLFPTAKSTEIMMLNKTDWETFAQETGASLDTLATEEGILQVAQQYYEWTDAQTPNIPDDGKAFYGRDAMSNYFILGMKQMGTEIFEVKDGTVTLNLDKDKIYRLWENYYVPYVKGYYASYGKFRSDDVKTGDIIAYTGSTASVFYFPDKVETDGRTYPIEYIMLDAPKFAGTEGYRVQQGAGMAVTKSDAAHEYASCQFLRWFTEKENNLRFVCNSGYLPVLKEANNIESLNAVIEKYDIAINDKSYNCLDAVMKTFDESKFYTTKSFANGYKVREILDYNLVDKAKADVEAIEAKVADGVAREEAVKPYLTDAAFESWYDSFCAALKQEAGIK